MKQPSRILAVLSLSLLSACQAQAPVTEAGGQSQTAETIADITAVTLTATRCFGTCPAYDLTIHAAGLIEFDGKYYTKEKGKVSRRVPASQAAALLQQLSIYRPATGTTTQNAACERRVTDHPSYHLTWGALDSKTPTRYKHYTGCLDAGNKPISRHLRELIKQVNLQDLIAPPTRYIRGKIKREDFLKQHQAGAEQ